MKDEKNKNITDSLERNKMLYDRKVTEIVQEEDETSIYEYDLPCLKNKGHLKRK